MKVTRRQMAAAVFAGAAAAQTTPPATATDDLQTARERIKSNAEALSRQHLPMDVEPAFQFKA